MPITFNPFWPVWLVLLIGFAAAAATLWAYASPTAGGTYAIRRVFLLLRFAALLLAVLCLLRPSIRREKIYIEKAKLVVLLDASESMSITDAGLGLSRAEELNRRLKQAQPQLDKLLQQFDVSVLHFGSEVRTGPLGPVKPKDTSTALGDALLAALGEAQGKRLAAIMVLSDGSSNAGARLGDAGQAVAQQQIAIVAVGFGKATGSVVARDVRVEAVHCPRQVYERNVLTVAADVLFLGCAGEQIELNLIFGDKAVDSKRVRVHGSRARTRIELQHTPTEAGTFKVRVRAAPVPDEAAAANNEMASFVRVLPGGFHVLYIEGRPRPELKFLKRCFQSAAGMEINAPLVLTAGGRTAGAKLPRTPQEWQRYDVIILGDAPCDVFTMSQLEAMEAAVAQKGSGLLMIGGVRNYAAGGYANTPVGRMLPVDVASSAGQTDKEFRLTPSPAGWRHFALHLDADQTASRKAWETLPKLKGAVRLGKVKPAATVLATDEQGAPVLVAQPFGRGRTMAFAADSTWRWVMSAKDTAPYFKRFWRQIALWLAGREDEGDNVVFLNIDEVRYLKGEKVRMEARVEDKDGKPVEDADVTASITTPSGERTPIALRYDSGRYHSTFFPTAAGDYAVALKALRAGRELGHDTGRFLVYERNLELEPPEAKLANLQALASASFGGAYFPSTRLRDALGSLGKLKSEAKVKKPEILDIWDNPLVFVIFLALLCTEWALRKWRGLV